MLAARRPHAPAPPPRQAGPIIQGSSLVSHWLTLYWQKLQLPAHELNHLAITIDRQEYMRWTGKRLNNMVLGCYCYLPGPAASRALHLHTRKTSAAPSLPGFGEVIQLHQPNHRHLIFIEPDMQPKS